jgi:hypothetical protein
MHNIPSCAALAAVLPCPKLALDTQGRQGQAACRHGPGDAAVTTCLGVHDLLLRRRVDADQADERPADCGCEGKATQSAVDRAVRGTGCAAADEVTAACAQSPAVGVRCPALRALLFWRISLFMLGPWYSLHSALKRAWSCEEATRLSGPAAAPLHRFRRRPLAFLVMEVMEGYSVAAEAMARSEGGGARAARRRVRRGCGRGPVCD